MSKGARFTSRRFDGRDKKNPQGKEIRRNGVRESSTHFLFLSAVLVSPAKEKQGRQGHSSAIDKTHTRIDTSVDNTINYKLYSILKTKAKEPQITLVSC
jgi:hypothetical protein